MKTKRHYFLMISCPGDVVKERELLKDCVEMINNERTDDVWVELQYWVTDTISDAGMMAQDSINDQIVNDSDGLIAIFNARLGTPVHDYKCGTDEEINLMLKAGKHVSLLFNSKPTIDLSDPNSIEQITKLQEYKNEQSSKAYYRQFSDEESFMVLALREIRLWLRSIIGNTSKTGVEIKITDNDISDVVPDTGDAESSNGDSQVIPHENTNEVSIDTEAGTIDCVVYITEAALSITEEFNDFSRFSKEMTEKTNAFNDKISMYKKQGSGNGGVLLACKDFSKEIDVHRDKVIIMTDNVYTKWNELYNYLMLLKDNDISSADKVILKDSIASLRICFEESLPKIDKFLETLSSMPNFQKDVKKSTVGLSSAYKKFKTVMIKAVENCEAFEMELI